MLKIGDFSKLTLISIRMLRHYDEMRILKPDSIDSFTNYRYYSAAQLPIANRINALKHMGFSLNAIKEIMTQYHDAEQLKNYLQVQLEDIKAQAVQTQNKLTLLESTIKRLRKGDIMMKYDVTLKEMPKRYVASLREVIPTYEDEGILWQKMAQEIAPQHVAYANPCYSVAVFYDQGYKENDVDVEIQVSVTGQYQDTQNVRFKTVEPIQMATVTFKGSFEQLIDVNACIGNWIMDNHYEFDGPILNIYHVSPGMDSNPDNWVTEVCYPIKKK